MIAKLLCALLLVTASRAARPSRPSATPSVLDLRVASATQTFPARQFLTFTIPAHDEGPSLCSDGSVPFGDQCYTIRVYASHDSTAQLPWPLVAEWGCRHLVGGTTYRILAWPDTTLAPGDAGIWYRVAATDTMYNVACESAPVRVR